jgi:uncharacterized protein
MKNSLSRRSFIASTSAAILPSAVAHAHSATSGLLAMLSSAPQTPTASGSQAWKDAGILDLSRSPYAKLKSVPVRAVDLQDGFWAQRRKTNLESSIPTMREQMLSHGRMDNFLRLAGKSTASQRGPLYSDSDVYKWVEAVGFVLQSSDQPQLRQTTQTMVRDIVVTQEPSGYINTYYVEDRKSLRMRYDIQTTGHEIYCLGHMIQSAIALYRANGDRTLLDASIRFVNNFLLPSYGPEPNQKGIVAGHPEIEMALIELYRTTGERKYLDLAGYILHGDERIPLRPQQIVYLYCGIPFTSRTKLEGHAVRAMYACCGATDYYLETGDATYWKTLTALWDDLTQHQLYVTGGVGARETGEAFGDPYELPNAQAYGESCAAIGMMMWNWRMLAASGQARFADIIERALYNGINSGMSLDGTTYCYRNPLAFNPVGDFSDRDDPEGLIRNPWYDTTCCPPNLERTFASLPGYFYSTSDDGIYVHLYDDSELNWHLHDGTALNIVQETNYPWNGKVKLTVTPATPTEFTLFLRIPGWSLQNNVRLNGVPIPGARAGQYLVVRRKWTANDHVEMEFDMTTRLLKANPAVTENRGRVAFQRGPVVFCMEQPDQADHGKDTDLADYSVQLGQLTKTDFDAHLLNGVMTLEHPGSIRRTSTNPGLYYSATETINAKEIPTTIKLIPYYAWANRGPAPMQVWIPYQQV